MKQRKIIAIVGVLILLAIVAICIFVKEKNKTFEVKFNSEGGSTVSTQTVGKYQRAVRPPDPQRERFCFYFLDIRSTIL